MPIVYLEELDEQVENKYLAVNIIAKRARALNDELLGAGLSKKKMPVSIATEELAAGELVYKKVDPKPIESDTPSIFASESSGFDAVDADEHFEELYGENAPEASEDEEETESETVEVSEPDIEDEG
ncbi:DNA-directed RNA polymerase subunit omega [Candidatus Poribacteria bacterium]|nr:DNA-directed RNA polymerase subunit omega [Candidatus Poribacteria bacterium]